MKIERKQLLECLAGFRLSEGDGVIIGSPGAGKTYCTERTPPTPRISAEIPGPPTYGSTNWGMELTETLRRRVVLMKANLIEKLKSIPVSGKNAILLLFDAFDAARDEQTRKRFLALIRRAIHELRESWNVIVTVRTYDAKKSQELLDLFGNPDATEHQSEEILCRHFTIPPFNEDEILQAFDQIGCPKSIYNTGSQDFKNILSNPFNLWLLEKIIQTSKNVPDFSQIRSEVQLFDLFWQRRITDKHNEANRVFILEKIARWMVKERSLTVRQHEVYEDLNLDVPARQTAWNDLQSDEILAKVSSTGQRIAFSHNILFDYAISVLLIDDEPEHLENFITEDPSRPLFLRPSLTYFFTRLWYYDDSTSFWKAFWHIFPSDQSVHLRLVARLIPTSVIANEAHKIDQLKPLLEELGNGEKGEIANEAVTRLLQALQTLQIKRDTLWINFFDQVSRHLHENFAWDLANLTSAILERTSEAENSEVINACGRIGRRLLEWVWQKREAGKNTWYDRFGGRWAVPLVAQTYHTNPEESRMLLEKVLELPKEDNFPIDFLARLTEHVDKIWEYDCELVTHIYHAVFAYQETSDEKVTRGGPIMPIATFRHQDYRMCQYRLVKHFHNFLQASPVTAARIVIQSLNSFIIRFHIVGYPKGGRTFEDLIKIFEFRGKPAYFVEDNSYMWDERQYNDEPIEMADMLFEFITKLAKAEDPLLDSLLDVFRDEVWVAFFWKRLLKTAAQFPKVFTPHLFELCIARPIQLHFETSYELGLFLEAAASEFTSDQLFRIEKSILKLSSGSEDNRESLEMRRNRLLAQIPMGLLLTDEARKIREKMEREGNIPENQPPVSFKTWSEPVTEEKWLQNQGVDTTIPENQELQRFSKHLNKFSSDWRNETPTQESVELMLPRLQEVYTTLKSDTEADQKVINLLWRNLTDCVAIIARIANNLESNSFAFCRHVLLEGAKHEQPIPNSKYDDYFDGPGYSPFPRHEAARGLLRLASHQPDKEILDAIETLTGDRVPSVRMVIAMELFRVYDKAPEKFWFFMENRATDERNLTVQEYLYFTLTKIAGRAKENEDKTTRVMAKLLEHTPLPPGKLASFDPFSFLLVNLAIRCENPWALKTIEDTFFNDPVRFSNVLTRAVKEAMETYVVPRVFETTNGREMARRAIELLEKVIDVVSNSLGELYKILKESETEEVAKQLHSTYEVIDRVITRLYYEVAHENGQSEKETEKISLELRRDFYNEVKPLMQQVITFAQDPASGIMLAPTAHYFMQLLKSFLGCNPKEVLHLATGVVKSSEPFGYNLDSIAVMDVVEFVEIVLADYRHEVRDGEALDDLLNLLDLFAKIGWSDALKLVWRLDEVFR